jgi:hypothetical protein
MISECLCITVPGDTLTSIRIMGITRQFRSVPVMRAVTSRGSLVGSRPMHLQHFRTKFADASEQLCGSCTSAVWHRSICVSGVSDCGVLDGGSDVL